MSFKDSKDYGLSIDHIKLLLQGFIQMSKIIKKVNDEKSKKLTNIRCQNFPSEISENLVRLILQNKYNTKCLWTKKSSGDLMMDSKRIEIKAFSTKNTPTSFGPMERWDILYFIDCTKYAKNKFKIYEITLSNTCNEWKNIVLNKNNETYYDHCKAKRRPRASFTNIRKQIGKRCVKIYDGPIL